MKRRSYAQLRELLINFPKVELHRHLEGTFDLPTLHRVSLRNGMDMPRDFKLFKRAVQFPKRSKPDFLKFLSKFKNDWYRNYKDIEEITYHSVKNLKSDGLFYIELRFSPEHFCLFNNFDRKDVTKLIIQAGNQAAAETGLRLKYLITFNRGKQNQNEMIDLYKVICSLNHPDIVGIDLAGDEMHFPVDDFTKFFEIVNKDGIFRSTIHAGEVTPSDEIWKAINILNAKRIGHGTSTISDLKLQEYLTVNQITLEQCLTSNYQTGSWIEREKHPMGRLLRLGVPVTINSDDPTIQDADLTHDYCRAVNYFSLKVEDLIQFNINAIKAAFLSENELNELRMAYLTATRQFPDTYL